MPMNPSGIEPATFQPVAGTAANCTTMYPSNWSSRTELRATNGREGGQDYGVHIGTEKWRKEYVSCLRRINSVVNNMG
jgi:hypothetical protein